MLTHFLMMAFSSKEQKPQAHEQTPSRPATGARLGEHAVVVGGSIGGMLAARVLSDHFARVTVIERDPVSDAPEARKGQPQARHLHGLLATGRALLESLYPGLVDEVVAQGGMTDDMGTTMHWHVYGGWRKRFRAGLPGLLSSRPLLESVVRRRTLALANVTLLDETAVQGLLWDEGQGRVTGVRVHRRAESDATQSAGKAQGGETIEAALVVDASGRGSPAPKWLEAAGYGRPPETVIRSEMHYATRLYERPAGHALGTDLMMIGPDPIANPRSGLLFPIEGERWIVTLGGRAGHEPPTDAAAYLEYARTLEAPDLYEILRRARPLGGVTPYSFPSNLRRHYERMARFPEGLLVLGDAICSFNPIYGQGMTTAALQADTLRTLLAQTSSLTGLARRFFKAADGVLAVPWQLTVGEDFRFATTVGKKPPLQDLINRYVERVHRATQRDTVVYLAFLKVMNLMAPPQSLFAPGIVRRVLWGRRAQEVQEAQGAPGVQALQG